MDLCLRLSGGNEDTRVVLPPGVMLISTTTDVQKGITVQEVRIVVPRGVRKAVRLRLYCANSDRGVAEPGVEFKLGPVTDHAGIREIIELVTGKTITAAKALTVKEAVWEATDTGALTDETRTALKAL